MAKHPKPPKPDTLPGKVKYRPPTGQPIERPLNRMKQERQAHSATRPRTPAAKRTPPR